uniref:(California timema) hypothetical protein n=1 Tax=Timema californicum TaxID=61474 RepID=A0A7R9PA00_TIMCA|nr:unnamed protein product [Timema californicum]
MKTKRNLWRTSVTNTDKWTEFGRLN